MNARALQCTPAARLAKARILGAGVRLEAAEVARLLEVFANVRKAGDADLAAARDAELAAEAARKDARRARKAPPPPPPAPVGPPLPGFPDPAATSESVEQVESGAAADGAA